MDKQLELDIVKALLHFLVHGKGGCNKTECETCSNLHSRFYDRLRALVGELGLKNAWDPREVARVFEQTPNLREEWREGDRVVKKTETAWEPRHIPLGSKGVIRHYDRKRQVVHVTWDGMPEGAAFCYNRWENGVNVDLELLPIEMTKQE